MTEVLIALAVPLAYALAGNLAGNLARIIWALRCSPDSPNYKCPSAPALPVLTLKLPGSKRQQP